LGVVVALVGTSAAADLFRPIPIPKPVSPPGKDEMAIGRFQCSQRPGETQGFSFIQFSGTSGITSPFLQGQFTTEAGTATPVTCQSLADQVAADASAGGCAVGPVANVESFGDSAITVHFVCNGGHDSVVQAISTVTRSLAAATMQGAID